MPTELTKMLYTAAKGKAPIVAIPIEGHAPVCLPRKRLAAWLKGVEVHSVEVVTPNLEKYTFRKPGEDTGNVGLYEGPEERIVTLVPNMNNRSVKIKGVVPSKGLAHSSGFLIKTSCTMFVVSRQQAALEIWKWADAERAKIKKIIGQGAISTAALKEAKKAAKAKERAAKLIEMERGGTDELEDAIMEERRIMVAARSHGRGPEKGMPPHWEKPEETAAKQAEMIVHHVSHHNVSHRVRKQAAVIQWRLKALRGEWYAVTKFNPHHRKTTANKFLKVKKSIRVIQIVTDYMALKGKLLSIRPEYIPNPRFPDHYGAGFYIDPLHRPNSYKKDHQNHYYEHEDRYDRVGLARRLRIVRETIRVLTPPPDEMEIAA